MPSAKVTAQKKGEPSYIITGSFKSRENAIRFSQTTRHKTLDARIGYSPNKKIYYVYIYMPGNQNDVYGKLKKVRESVRDAWVHTGKLILKSTSEPEASKPGYVVAGSFKNSVNAKILSETLGINGVEAQINYDHERELYYVYTLASNDESTLRQELQKLRSIPSLKNSWILNGTQRKGPENSTDQLHNLGYVIAGSYTKLVNAKILKDELGIAGIEANITYDPKHKLYYVYTLASHDKGALEEELHKIKNIPNLQGSWILDRGLEKLPEGPVKTIKEKQENKVINDSRLNYIMTEKFKSQEDAAHSAARYSHNGLNARVGYNPEQELYYVYIYKSRDLSVVVEKLHEYATTKNLQDTWVYTGPPLIEDFDRTATVKSKTKDNHTTTAAGIDSRKTNQRSGEVASSANDINNAKRAVKEATPDKKELLRISGSEENSINASQPKRQPNHQSREVAPTNDIGEIQPMATEVRGNSDIEISEGVREAPIYEKEVIESAPANTNSRPRKDKENNSGELPGLTQRSPDKDYEASDKSHTTTETDRLADKRTEVVNKLNSVIKKANEVQQAIKPSETNRTGAIQDASNPANEPIYAHVNELINKTAEVVEKLNEAVNKATEKTSEGSNKNNDVSAMDIPTKNIASRNPGNELNNVLSEVMKQVDQLVSQLDEVVTTTNLLLEEAEGAEKAEGADETIEPDEVEKPEKTDEKRNIEPGSGNEALLANLNELIARLAEVVNEVSQMVNKVEEILNNEPEQQPLAKEETKEEKAKDKQSSSFWNSKASKRPSRDQRTILISVGLGMANYFGDLKDKRGYLDVKASLSAGFKTFIRPRIAGRVELNLFRLSGDDGLSLHNGKSTRNLSFRSDNIEINVSGALHMLPIGKKFYRRPLINPYGFVGIGLLYYNPMGKIPETTWQGQPLPGAGRYIPLQPLQTENVKYRRISIVVPIGFGFTCKINPYINLGFEAGYRITNTDYLDDVSTTYRDHGSFNNPLAQAMADKRHLIGLSPLGLEENHIRGNPTNNDGYLLMNLKFEYFIPPISRRRR